jgi:hypothetical protein
MGLVEVEHAVEGTCERVGRLLAVVGAAALA